MTTRILPPEEWSKLTGTLLEYAWPLLTPDDTRILVVEQGDQIVACVSLFRRWHLDGAWIAPHARQRVSVGRSLWKAVKALFVTEGVDEVLTMALNGESARLSERLGRAVHLDCEHFAVFVGRT